jgi:hypothetical protein
MIKGVGRFDGTRYGYCIVTLCKGKAEEKDFYAFVAIEPQNYPYFQQRYPEIEGRESDFRPYGKELLRGWGTAPPDDIFEHVSNKYSIEFDVRPEFVERLVALTRDTTATSFPLKPAKAS